MEAMELISIWWPYSLQIFIFIVYFSILDYDFHATFAWTRDQILVSLNALNFPEFPLSVTLMSKAFM